MTITRIAAIAMLALLASCRGGGALNSDPYSQNPIEAAMDSGPKKTRADGADFSRFKQVTIARVGIDPDATQGDSVSAEQLEKLREEFTTDLTKAFAAKFAVVPAATSAPTLAVRATIVRAVPNKPLRNILPQTQVGRTGYGYAAVRVQLCDAATGAELAAFTETRSTKRFGLEKLSEWGNVEKSFETWAKEAVELAH